MSRSIYDALPPMASSYTVPAYTSLDDINMSEASTHEPLIKTENVEDELELDFPIEVISIAEYLQQDPIQENQQSSPSITTSRQGSKPMSFANLSLTDQEAVPVSRSITTEYPRQLNEYITAHHPNAGLPQYVFTERVLSKFSVLVKFNDGYDNVEPPYMQREGVDDPVPQVFPSKKLAKEEAAKWALDYLKSVPPSTHLSIASKAQGEQSFAGELNTFCSARKTELPAYTDYSSKNPPYHFGCELRLPCITDKVFGQNTPIYQNKKVARNVAAQQALQWLKCENPRIIPKYGNTKKSGILTSGSTLEIDVTGKSPGVIIGEICPHFGFKGPKYILEKNPECDGMYDISAVLEPVPGLEGGQVYKLGPLKNQYGAKNAKEQSAKTVLKFLRDVHAARLGIKVVFTGTYHFVPLR